MEKHDFKRFLEVNNLSIKVVPVGDGWNTLKVFYKGHLIADMNEFKGELDLNWAYEYIMDLSGSSYTDPETKNWRKVPTFLSFKEIKSRDNLRSRKLGQASKIKK